MKTLKKIALSIAFIGLIAANLIILLPIESKASVSEATYRRFSPEWGCYGTGTICYPEDIIVILVDVNCRDGIYPVSTSFIIN